MLTEEEINNYKQLIEKGKKAEQELNSIEAEINVRKEQCIEKLKAHGCKKFSDIDTVLLPRLQEIEEKIKNHSTEIEEYIKYVNEKKEEKEQVIMEG